MKSIDIDVVVAVRTFVLHFEVPKFFELVLWFIQTFVLLLFCFTSFCLALLCKRSSHSMLTFRLAAKATKRRTKRERKNDTHKTNKEFKQKKVRKHVFPLSTLMFSFFPFLLSMRRTRVHIRVYCLQSLNKLWHGITTWCVCAPLCVWVWLNCVHKYFIKCRENRIHTRDEKSHALKLKLNFIGNLNAHMECVPQNRNQANKQANKKKLWNSNDDECRSFGIS